MQRSQKKYLDIEFPREPYIPLNVYKAFVKMALSMLPSYLIENFKSTIIFTNADNTIKRLVSPYIVWQTSYWDYILINNNIFATFLIRKNETATLPYCFFILEFSNYLFQIIIPTNEMDVALSGQNLYIPPYPSVKEHNDKKNNMNCSHSMLDFNSNEKTRDDFFLQRIGFQDYKKEQYCFL